MSTLLDKAVVSAIPFMPKPIIKHFANPYIAGETLTDAIKAVKRLNGQGIMATIDVLGESVNNFNETKKPVKYYLKVLEEIERNNLDANISIKPTQFGLGLDPEFCLNNYKKVIKRLRPTENFLRVDMEDSPFTTLTYDLLDNIRQEYSNVGVVIQAYLHRSLKDLKERLIPHKTNIRLCKGIYIEPEEISYRNPDVVRRNYVRLLETALKAGLYVGIATHDEILVWEAYRIIDELQLDKDKYEFQMLLGVTEKLRRQIVADGHRMRVYVPFGRDWYAYSTRRLKENPKIAGYVLKEILHLT